ncbi:hypothetical protein [Bradyrhizobium sp. STM 3561]|uniref:hypothetical protein n=1 Tax=Bradyrhizobium sp. STM 3561 TaxID=578923 RepID=UPI00388DCDC3
MALRASTAGVKTQNLRFFLSDAEFSFMDGYNSEILIDGPILFGETTLPADQSAIMCAEEIKFCIVQYSLRAPMGTPRS